MEDISQHFRGEDGQEICHQHHKGGKERCQGQIPYQGDGCPVFGAVGLPEDDAAQTEKAKGKQDAQNPHRTPRLTYETESGTDGKERAPDDEK